jgi:mRNA interferase MazF
VTVVVVTGSAGPPETHVALGTEAGLTGHDVSYANATDLHTLAAPRLHHWRGRLNALELARLEEAVRIHLGL